MTRRGLESANMSRGQCPLLALQENDAYYSIKHLIPRDPISLPFLSFLSKRSKMSIYGTISEQDPEEASLSSSSNKQFHSRTKELLQTILGARKPWKDMIHPSHLTFPFSFFNSIQRIKTNVRVFRTNYVVIILFILFLSLLWHPISVIIFCAVMVAWTVLYFVRDNPLRAFGYEIDERLVAMLLLLVTVGLIFLSNVTDNILVGMCVGVVIVLVHGVMRKTEEDEEEAGIVKIRLRHAASSSFTTP